MKTYREVMNLLEDLLGEFGATKVADVIDKNKPYLVKRKKSKARDFNFSVSDPAGKGRGELSVNVNFLTDPENFDAPIVSFFIKMLPGGKQWEVNQADNLPVNIRDGSKISDKKAADAMLKIIKKVKDLD